METNDQVFIDSVELSDAGPKGLVILTDKKTGKVIFKKHNLVVAQGRKYIFSLFASKNYSSSVSNLEAPNNIFTNSEYQALQENGLNLSGKKLSFLEFGIGTNDVSLSDTSITSVVVSDQGNTYHPLRFKIIPNSASQDTANNVVKVALVENSGRYYLKFEFNFEGTILENVSDGSKHLVSELGLFLAEDSAEYGTDNGYLFSRIRFDTIPITNDSSLLLQYYVYF